MDTKTAVSPTIDKLKPNLQSKLQPLAVSFFSNPSLQLYSNESQLHTKDTRSLFKTINPYLVENEGTKKSHNSRNFKILQQGIREAPRHLLGTQSRSLSSRKYLSEDIQRTYQRIYYIVLSYGLEEIPSHIEDRERSSPICSDPQRTRAGRNLVPTEEEIDHKS